MGHHNRHFAGDRYASAGVWGTPTSTANFCEEDYAVTLYIAEFINTLTNLAYIYYAVQYPGKRTVRRSADGAVSSETRPWTQPDLFAIALWVLGVLSLVFHATLKHTTQYGDELAMLVLAGALLQGSWGVRSRAAALVSWSAVVAASALYLRTGQILHQVYAFQSMIFVVGVRTIYLIRQTGTTTPQGDVPKTEARLSEAQTQGARRRRALFGDFFVSLATLALGFFLWNVDLERCADLRRYRAAVGLPWAWVLELHGWWHVLTALGASQYIRLLRELDA